MINIALDPAVGPAITDPHGAGRHPLAVGQRGAEVIERHVLRAVGGSEVGPMERKAQTQP